MMKHVHVKDNGFQWVAKPLPPLVREEMRIKHACGHRWNHVFFTDESGRALKARVKAEKKRSCPRCEHLRDVM